MSDAGREVVRFAPSPTGEIHIGNARTALYNWAVAARSGGEFVLRLDDTDWERSQERFVALIGQDLSWLGVRAARTVRQSERLALYDAAAARLRTAGLLYPCYETPEELERKRALQRSIGRPPVYDRAALELSGADRQRREEDGRRPHWRFRLPGDVRQWTDLCRGPQTVDLASVSDPVLVRGDGSYLYTLPSVVDDADLAVTTVVRGEDHITNTGVQLALFESLGVAAPAFAHHNLLVRSDGEPLSKRDNPLSVARLRANGLEPMAVASLAMLVGTSQPVEPVADLDALVARADLGSISRGPATFDPTDLDRLNAALLHDMPYADVADWLRATHGVTDGRLWEVVRSNLGTRDDVALWVSIWRDGPKGTARVTADEAAVLSAAATVLPEAPWDEGTFRAWTGAVREATGARGRALFMPLRVALTGRTEGPELGPLIGLLGRDEVRARLERAASTVDARC